MKNKIPMTPEGHAQLAEELKRLKNQERPAVIEGCIAGSQPIVLFKCLMVV